MITIPTSIDEATSSAGEFRAGGTDLQERRRSGKSTGPIVDISRVDLKTIRRSSVGLSIGALTTVGNIAKSSEIRTGWPALALTARGLATPQIREVATIGGNLVQQTRCPYARHAVLSCAKSGGTGCPARTGNHYFGVAIDQGPCVAPHPSSLGVALLIYDATVHVDGTEMPIRALWGDGSDPTRNHYLNPGQLITAIVLPEAVEGETGGYVRAISRFEAEWPLAEAAVRVVLSPNGTVSDIGVAVGGVANTPLRLKEIEAVLNNRKLTDEAIGSAAQLVASRCTPLPNTQYKVPLLVSVISDALLQARGSARQE
jgi:xanthine dehydrogenase YagS FAD-binding subunit